MNVLNEIKDILSRVLGSTDQAFLFGSRARGTNRQSSDWDILVLLDKDKIETNDYDNVSYPLTSFGWSIGQVISPILYSKKEWLQQIATPFYKNVNREAIALI